MGQFSKWRGVSGSSAQKGQTDPNVGCEFTVPWLDEVWATQPPGSGHSPRDLSNTDDSR